ncbi:MAG: hypothetical protein IJO29_04950 [Oscillospiraceae bacterium]|nr:hypothetical protein [Oscillospiraceae bacterium]
MKFIDRIRSRRLKGAVLFTVVSVCAVIIIFVMATLTVVATVQKRTYSDYAKSQSYYTARSAVNSVITALNESDDLALTFKNISGRTDLNINMSSSTDMGQITSCYVDKISDEMYKICATARVLDDESTVAVYVYEGTKIEPSSGKSSSSAITTFGTANSNNLSMIGGSAVNVYADTCPSGEPLSNSNNSGIVGDFVVNGNYELTNNTKFVLESGQGASIYGDLIFTSGADIYPLLDTINDNSSGYDSYYKDMTYPVKEISEDSVKLSDIPYIFCTGKLDFVASGCDVGYASENSNVYCPVNIYCGYLAGSSANFSGGAANFYCYDSAQTSQITQGGFSLYSWIQSLNQSSTTFNVTEIGGNFYTKGDLSLTKTGGVTYVFQGDLCVDGTLTVISNDSNHTTTIKVGGDLKVGKLEMMNTKVKFTDLDGNDITPYITSVDKVADLANYYSALGVSDWDAMRSKLTASPATKVVLGGATTTYQDVLDTFTFFTSDYELKNMLSGYYYAYDAFGQLDDSIIYHDNVKTGTEPASYEYQKPETGFINTVATVKEQFPVDSVKSPVDADGNITTEIYECETYSSIDEFDTVLKSEGNYLKVTFNGSNCTVRILDATDKDITDTITDTSKYYSVDSNGVYTFYTNAIFTGSSQANGKVHYIDPQTAKKDLYIRLEDFSLNSNDYLVVKDEKLKSTVNGSEVVADQYMCYMYASTASTPSQTVDQWNKIYTTNCITLSNAGIVSEYYYNYLTKGTNIYLEQYPTEDNYRQMPNIYMYVQPYTNINAGSNLNAITAYITAPRSSLSIDNGRAGSGSMYYTTGEFTDTNVTPPKATAYSQQVNKSIALLGSFVFGSANMKNATVSYIYISDEGRGDDDTEDNGTEVYTWQPLYYDSN